METSPLQQKVADLNKRWMNDHGSIRSYDLVELLLELHDTSLDEFYTSLRSLHSELLADVLSEFSPHLQEEIAASFGREELAEITSEMDSDDAADFIQNISEQDAQVAEDILARIDPVDQEVIRALISYEEGTAGAHMQKELFWVKIDDTVQDSIENLRKLKTEGLIDSISQVFIVEGRMKLVAVIGLEDLVMLPLQQTFRKNIPRILSRDQISVNHMTDIDDVVEFVTKYNLSVVPVVGDKGELLGRITSDDIYDIIENRATEDIYHLAGVDASAEDNEKFSKRFGTRAIWLAVNLLTAIAASLVVSLFDSTIQTYVALAVLMPIVASMGGNAGTQSLTVTVRQLSTGRIDFADALPTIGKELMLSLFNGLLFALVIGIATHYWFDLPNLGYVIAASTIINLLAAGLFGAGIPILMEKLGIDPAIASTVILTTITDIVGFFSFLALAHLAL